MSRRNRKPSCEKRDAARSEMAADTLRQNGRLRLRARGESMLPTLWPGDIVEVTRCSISELRRGDVVLAIRDGRLFLHRFFRQSGEGFVLRGDSMPAPDPVYSSEAFLARLKSRTAGRQFFTTLPPVLSRSLGFILCHCGIARRLALRAHYSWKEHRAAAAKWFQAPEAMHE